MYNSAYVLTSVYLNCLELNGVFIIDLTFFCFEFMDLRKKYYQKFVCLRELKVFTEMEDCFQVDGLRCDVNGDLIMS